jgi:hypothetical protein
MPLHAYYMFRPVLRLSSDISIQKSCKLQYNKTLRGFLFTFTIFSNIKTEYKILIYRNKMPTRCNRCFYCRSYCLLNMFQALLCPSSGALEYYLRNRWTLDIGVLGYIGIVWPKEHPPEVLSVPPVTLCIQGVPGGMCQTSGEVWNYGSCYTLIDYQIHIKTGRNMWFL